MAEPLKNLFNRDIIGDMSHHLTRVWDSFDQSGFLAAATEDLESLELKQRSAQIERALDRFLPPDFPQAASILLQSLHPDEDAGTTPVAADGGIAGWAIMPMSGYVGRHGVGHLQLALDVMKELTKRLTAEFGIRFLIQAKPQPCLDIMRDWTRDPNRHVRRLVSEGTRPRLPWAPRLPMFIEDPTPLLPLLVELRDDPEEYVRRSVANSLNDIAKDHPDLVADIVGKWLVNAPEPRQRLVRHACRSLIKQGNSGALTALGYGEAQVKIVALTVKTPTVRFGSKLDFELQIASTAATAQDLIIDYAVHHQKADGSLSPKIFKWKTVILDASDSITLQRRHPMRPVTTRVYYPGRHKLEIQINGRPFAEADFDLEIPADS